MLAKELATLDVLSGGRVEPGLGAGFLRREYEVGGIRFDPPGDRVGRLDEALQVLKGLFGPEPLTYHGRHYRLDGLDGFPKPVQRPHPRCTWPPPGHACWRSPAARPTSRTCRASRRRAES